MQTVDEAEVLEARERAERRDAVESRRRILQEARRLFEEMGVGAVSMHAIAHAAGVGQGTLYRRYANKGELCFDLIKESAGDLQAGVEAYLQQSADLPALTRLDGVLERLVAYTEEKLPMMGAIRDAYCGDNRVMQFANPFYRWIHGCIAGLYTEAEAMGDIAPLDPAFTADALLGVLSPQVYEFQRRERGFTPEQILSGVRRLYTSGLL
jgi:AcrR family transcriptional regulator